MQWGGHWWFVRMAREGLSGEGVQVRRTVWEQSQGAKGTAGLCWGPSGEMKGPMCLRGQSEGQW